MRIIEERTKGFSMRRPVVGCGIQNEQCLALEASGGDDAWSIRWALMGDLGESDFARELSSRTGRTHLWSSLTEEGALQTAAAAWIELPRSGEEKIQPKEKVAALRTQTMNRFASVDEVVLRGVEVSDGGNGPAHLVGGVALKRRVEEDFASWRRIMKIRFPHIASNSMALVNAFLALYPRTQDDDSCRIVFLEGRAITRAVVMQDWRFLDAIEFRMLENQDRLNELLIRHWTDTMVARHALETIPKPLVILGGEKPAGFPYEVWNPFSGDGVRIDRAARELVVGNLDLATIAFGMALQGGM